MKDASATIHHDGTGRRLLRTAGDYVALTKPRLTLVAVVTAMFGFYAGATGGAGGVFDAVSVVPLLHLLAGTALLGAGLAALNQYMERRLDARMARTAQRPIPSGRVRPGAALAFGSLTSLAGVAQLGFNANVLTAVLGAATLLLYLFCYVPLKTRSPWCTPVGAVPGALPPVIGYAAAAGTLDAQALVLFAIVYLWQLPHFMAIAVVYRDEYRAAGMPMLPVVDDDDHRRTARHILLQCFALFIATLWPTYLHLAGETYLMIALLLGFIFGAFAFDAATNTTIASARRLFLASIFYLPVLFSVMIWDKTLQ
ncbi:MAG: protoheme IX farnesyltransferase [Phycisphaeraceae bacterium]|nr:protoheme IX farnesyltransferase [Phycisphaeraceae bacterium]